MDLAEFRRLLAEEGLQRHDEADDQHQAVADDGRGEKGERPGIEMPERGVDLLLGEEAEAGRQAAHGKGAGEGGEKGDRQGAGETAEAVHVARARFVVDDAGDHEEAALEHGVGHQVEHRRGDGLLGAEAGQHHHQAERRHGRVGEHQLEVGLPDRQHGAEDERRARRRPAG